MGKVQIYRNGVATIELPLQDAVFTRALQGDHKLVFSLRSPAMLDLRIGDTLTYKGEVMTINRDPKRAKVSSLQYDTEVTFEGHRHTLARFLLKDEGAISFDYFGSLDEFMYMFLESVNGDDSGWTLGDIDTSEPVGLTFDKTDCFSALNMIAQAFGFEWQIRNKVISVQKTVGLATTIELAYGKDNGLYNLTREATENGRIVNRAYGYGGSNNLPQGYSGKALRLTTPLEDAASIALYGVREGAYSDDSIYPQRTSTATAVGQINEGTFTLDDSTIDFDLDGQRISGTEAKIVFKSGALNGQEFKILSYNHQHKRIRYEANKDSNGALTPSGLRVAEVGDSYTLIGIRMPSTYVDAALRTLSEKTQEYLNSNKVPRVVYSLSIDILDAKRKGVYPNEGDFIHVTDTDLAIDEDLRVTSVSYPALFPDALVPGMQFSCEVGNDVTYTFLQKIEKDIKETKEVVTVYKNQSIESNRRSVTALNEFKNMVFDPDGNMQQPMLEAMAGIFGTKSQMFDLNGVTITENYLADPNKLLLSEGNLIHYAYDIPTIGNVWNIAQLSISGLASEKAYYIALKASRTSESAVWDVSPIKRMVDEDPNFWYFNFGVLSSVIENNRSIRPTNMFTAISGGTVETNILIAKILMLPYMSIGKNGENAQRFYYDIEQKKTGAIFGIVDGIPKLIWYDEETGVEIWNASKNGIIYVTNTPESWTADRLLQLHTIATEDEGFDESAVQSVLTSSAVKESPGQVYISGGITGHFYDAGVNDSTSSNVIYQGYHTSNTKDSSFVANGYYYISASFLPEKEYLLQTGEDKYQVMIIKLWNGKIKGAQAAVEIMVY